MNRLWQKEYYLRAIDFDKFDRIKPSAVLELFQDAAGQHALELGLGFKDLVNRSMLWVLTRVKFKILTTPKSYQKVIVKTWPLAPNRLNFRREYCIENEAGEKLIIGSSEWVIIHSEKRRFLSVPDLYPFSDGFHNELMFEEKLTKIPDFETEIAPRIINVGFSDLDINNHVNNTKYANYVIDAVNPCETDELETFQIDYRKEVFCDTQLNIYHSGKENNEILAKGVNPDGDTAFACKIQYKTP